MRDGLGVLLVAIGLTWAVLTRDKLGLVVAFDGVTLLAYGIFRPDRPSADGGKEPLSSEVTSRRSGDSRCGARSCSTT